MQNYIGYEPETYPQSDYSTARNRQIRGSTPVPLWHNKFRLPRICFTSIAASWRGSRSNPSRTKNTRRITIEPGLPDAGTDADRASALPSPVFPEPPPPSAPYWNTHRILTSFSLALSPISIQTSCSLSEPPPAPKATAGDRCTSAAVYAFPTTWVFSVTLERQQQQQQQQQCHQTWSPKRNYNRTRTRKCTLNVSITDTSPG